MSNDELRKLPGVDTLLKNAALIDLAATQSRELVVQSARDELADVRSRILEQSSVAPTEAELVEAVSQRVNALLQPTLQPVINATGVLVHTNLGRSLLSRRARQAMVEASAAYSNLEYDLAGGQRGSRYHHAEALLCQLSGAEAAVVVNNNAAALILGLSVLAAEKEVLISRSQLIEIGGGFRIPDIMRQSGATLVEVGATNRTYVKDYEDHLHTVNTGLILKVHHSNFKLVGFTGEPTLSELVELGDRYGVPVLDDLGSGTLLDTAPYGLEHEPTIQESIAAGASLVTASGDKLLGGPQAGLMMGRADIINKLKKHPLIRAFRVDKTTLAALQATLLAYLEGKAVDEIPLWQMISASPQTLNRRALKWKRALAQAGITARVIHTNSTVGGGSLPGQQFPTRALSLEVESPNAVAGRLRACSPPIIARVEADQLVLDPRTVLPEQDQALIKGVQSVIQMAKR